CSSAQSVVNSIGRSGSPCIRRKLRTARLFWPAPPPASGPISKPPAAVFNSSVLRRPFQEATLKNAIEPLYRAAIWLIVLGIVAPLVAAESDPTRDEVIAAMKPREGPPGSAEHATLVGKVMCGYQGWFAAEEDGFGRGWYHYTARSRFEPGSCSIDLWPDLS